MKEVITTPDGKKLIAVYQGLVQTPSLKRDENRYRFVYNPKVKSTSLFAQRMFDTPEEAKAAIMEEIRRCNRGARVETSYVGGIGIGLEIDEQMAKDFQITAWYIRKQWRTEWETVEKSGTTA